MNKTGTCPLCENTNTYPFLELSNIPLVNTLGDDITKYPLNVHFCENCGLVFINTPRDPGDIFRNYTYFSSFSSTWLSHCKDLFHEIEDNHLINSNSFIIEIASNDGYMLKNFIDSGYKSVLGIEPSHNTAAEALKKGIPTINDFFTEALADKLASGKKADCIIALNVLAHVPDIMDFLRGIGIILSTDGFAILEFHHLLSLIEKTQFDTIYHEHFSYLSLATVKKAVESAGMRIFDAKKVETQGGSLRIFVSNTNANALRKYPVRNEIEMILLEEKDSGLNSLDAMASFADSTARSIETSKKFIMELFDAGKKIAGYGAAAKAVVYINNLNLDSDVISCVADINPVKQGLLIPGTSIPIVSPDKMLQTCPDYVIIFPWNIKDEILIYLKEKLSDTTHFIIFTPDPEVL